MRQIARNPTNTRFLASQTSLLRFSSFYYVFPHRSKEVTIFNIIFIYLHTQQNSMNPNPYRRHKSSNLQAQKKDKVLLRTSVNLPTDHHLDELLREAKNIYHSQSHIERAVQAFEKYLEVFPTHDEALYLCGVCLIQMERLEAAVQKLSKVSEEYPLKHNALLLASIAYNKMGLQMKSHELVGKCIKKAPFFEEAICFRAKLYMQMNNYVQAEIDFRNAVGLNSKSFLGLMGLADCHRFSGNYESAIKGYNQSKAVLNSNNSAKDKMQVQLYLKIAICLYCMERIEECIAMLHSLTTQGRKCSQLYYYYGLCELKLNHRQEGKNHLEYAIRLDSSPAIIEKAFRKLLLLCLQNFEFYDAENVVKLGKIYNIQSKHWDTMIGAFIRCIRLEFPKALQGINEIYEILKADKTRVALMKLDKEEEINDLFVKDANLFKRKGSLGSSEQRIKVMKKRGIKMQSAERKVRPLFKVKRSIDKIESTRANISAYQSFPLKFGRFKTEYREQKPPQAIFNEKERQIIYPLLLEFKAYCEFFTNKLVTCIQTLDEYEAYLLNNCGKDFNLKYSRAVCEIILLTETNQDEEALVRCNEALTLHLQKYDSQALQPLLYKISILIRMAIANAMNEQKGSKLESHEILVTTLEMISGKQILKNNPIGHYFTAFIFVLVDDYCKAKQCLDIAAKISQDYSSAMYYSKALVQMKLGYYISAFKDITTSILIENTEKAYLARALILLSMSQEKDSLRKELLNLVSSSLNIAAQVASQKVASCNEKYVQQFLLQRCLSDLQVFIEFCDNDEDLALWVTKILFTSGSYDEALSSLEKVIFQDLDIIIITNCLSIYNGDFQKGGRVGQIIKQSFDGVFLDQEEEKRIFSTQCVKEYNPKGSDYLQQSYEKWLVILNLYTQAKYELCIRYIQKEIFDCDDEESQLLLRYNLAMIYFLTQDHEKGINTIKSLSKFNGNYNIQPTINSIISCDFVADQCLKDLTSLLFLRSSKMLSDYLSYKSIFLFRKGEQMRIYMRINIPFPDFYRPNLQLEFDINFILQQLSLDKIPKRIEEPWIKRVNKSIQFTSNWNDSVSSFESKTPKDSAINLPVGP